MNKVKKISRQQLTEAAAKVVPDYYKLHENRLVSATSLWQFAMEEAFLKNLKGEHVDVLRAGLLQFRAEGYID